MLTGYTCSFASDGGDALARNAPTARPSVTATAREMVVAIGTLGDPTAARALIPEPSPFR